MWLKLVEQKSVHIVRQRHEFLSSWSKGIIIIRIVLN
jgi:hypothetical protein